MYNLNLNDFADIDSDAMIFYTDFNKKEFLLYEAWYSNKLAFFHKSMYLNKSP